MRKLVQSLLRQRTFTCQIINDVLQDKISKLTLNHLNEVFYFEKFEELKVRHQFIYHIARKLLQAQLCSQFCNFSCNLLNLFWCGNFNYLLNCKVAKGILRQLNHIFQEHLQNQIAALVNQQFYNLDTRLVTGNGSKSRLDLLKDQSFAIGVKLSDYNLHDMS